MPWPKPAFSPGCARPGCRRGEQVRRPCRPQLDAGSHGAHTAGVNRTYLSKLEKAASYPGLEIIAKLAHYAFWVELARAATAAVPEKANAPTV